MGLSSKLSHAEAQFGLSRCHLQVLWMNSRGACRGLMAGKRGKLASTAGSEYESRLQLAISDIVNGTYKTMSAAVLRRLTMSVNLRHSHDLELKPSKLLARICLLSSMTRIDIAHRTMLIILIQALKPCTLEFEWCLPSQRYALR
jgi:hypothetical protein